MKSNKRGYLLFLVVLLIPLLNAGITGQATSQETGVSVSVVSNIPSLEITSPQNITYTEGDYILLDWTENLIDRVWYNLDNTANTTINASFYFQTSVGSHTLYLYGNQSNGTVLSDQVIFSVTAAPAPLPSGGGGGGRPREIIVKEPVEEKIPIILQQGETKQVKLLLKNEENTEKRIRIEDQNIGNLLTKISDIEFYLSAGQSREVIFTFYAPLNKIPELYIEKVLVKTEDTTEKEISFYIEVESLDFLFDVKVEIPEKPEIFIPGEELIAIVDFYNLGKQEEAEVNIEYLIKNEQGKIIFGEKQSLIIGTSVTITKKLELPKNIEEGDYVFYVKATYDSKTASASKWFRIETKKIFNLGEIGEELSKDKDKIAGAIAILTGLYILSTTLEILFGKKGKYHILKKRTPVKKRIKKKRVIKRKRRKKIKYKPGMISRLLGYKK